ncbi:hypothetical protein BJV74DRAFT_779476 [Russula compacta]|nr:hypothetical protein BJV74DRAFT_779476 [Russula compacta]
MDPSPTPTHPGVDLDWSHIGIGLAFIAFTSAISHTLQLHVGASLVIAALRCIVQLTLVATVLQRVFAAKSAWTVALIALLLNTLGTFETVVIKAKRRCQHMFPSVLFAMLVSTVPVSILGAHFAMRVAPFWTPDQFIPIMGMMCGNAITGVTVSQSYVLKELDENRDKTETLLAFGASRFEACRPLAVETLRLALLPTINQMSVIGIIAIPGMMTGAILGGADVQQAARLQMIIVFMISASCVLSCMIATLFTLSVCVDSEHRIRGDRIDTRPHALQRATGAAVRAVVGAVRGVWIFIVGGVKQILPREEEIVGNSHGGHDYGVNSRSERTPLLA